MKSKQVSVRLPLDLIEQINLKEGKTFTNRLLAYVGYVDSVGQFEIQSVLHTKLEAIEARLSALEGKPIPKPIAATAPTAPTTPTNVGDVLTMANDSYQIEGLVIQWNIDGLGKRRIARKLQELGYLSIKGNLFTESSVGSMLARLKAK